MLLVRHATCARTHDLLLGRSIDAALDANGSAQARTLAAALRHRVLPPEDIALVQSSPRLRTRQTAAAVAGCSQDQVPVAPQLDELDFGRWAGCSFAELEHDPDWRRWNRQRGSAHTPAGDDMAAANQRITAHLRALAPAYQGRTVVLVTHAEVIRALLLVQLGLPFDAFASVQVPPASWTAVSVHGNGALQLHDAAAIAASVPPAAPAPAPAVQENCR